MCYSDFNSGYGVSEVCLCWLWLQVVHYILVVEICRWHSGNFYSRYRIVLYFTLAGYVGSRWGVKACDAGLVCVVSVLYLWCLRDVSGFELREFAVFADAIQRNILVRGHVSNGVL
eukprot:gene3278-2260_t